MLWYITTLVLGAKVELMLLFITLSEDPRRSWMPDRTGMAHPHRPPSYLSQISVEYIFPDSNEQSVELSRQHSRRVSRQYSTQLRRASRQQSAELGRVSRQQSAELGRVSRQQSAELGRVSRQISAEATDYFSDSDVKIPKGDSSEEEDADAELDTRCGLGSRKPSWLQACNNPRAVCAWLCWFAIVQGKLFVLNRQIHNEFTFENVSESEHRHMGFIWQRHI